VAPNPDVAPCSGTFTTITDLFAGFVPTGNGTIWVVWGPASTGTAVISPTGSWSGVGAYSLTFQGGWEGTPGSTSLHTADPYSYFSDLLWIHTWVGAVTIKNVVFDGVSMSSVLDFGALEVFTKGNIVLDKVRVDDSVNLTSFAHGAFLDNTSGSGSVTVSNSSFNNNEYIGLLIMSKGAITLKNVHAYENVGSGASLANDTATGKAVVISNSEFSGNSVGLYVFSDGNITLNNIIANLNVNGAYLQNTGATIAAPVYVNGFNSFSGNGADGLHIESHGLIKVSKTTANENGGYGVILYNQLSPFYVGVTISGYLMANDNVGKGLAIYSTGVVTAANISTMSNGQGGTQITNSYCPITGCVPKNVTISGINLFNDNGYEGLKIESRGAVTLYNVTANNNGYTGDHGGVFITNDYDAAKQMAVTLNGYNMFNDNSNTGLSVESFGAVTLNNVTAVDNGHGVEDVYGVGAYVQNGGGVYAKAVAIKGTNIFSGSDANGLEVNSDGAISVSKTTATGNDNTGVLLANNTSSVNSGVSISSYLMVNDNGGIGLDINTRGAVLAAYLTANGNNLSLGALIKNDYSPTVQMPVSLTGVNTFIGNGNSGLEINSTGVITLNNITALNNGLAAVDGIGSGVDVNNTGGVLPKAVYVKGVNTFSGNDDTGLQIISYGLISVSKITAEGNGKVGAHFDNGLSSVQSNVALIGYGVFNSNGAFGGSGDGLEVWSYGAITLAYISSQFNYGSGAELNTVGVTTVHSVTLTGANSFNFNGDSGGESGLLVNADGNITVHNLTASYNHSTGAALNNYDYWAVNTFSTYGSVFVYGFGSFVGNMNGDGLYVKTHGNITLNRVSASGNGDDGFELWAGQGIGGTGTVTITCSSAYGNADVGLFISTPGIVTLKGFLAYGNLDDEDIGGTIVRAVCP
jgi:hypothetical protein